MPVDIMAGAKKVRVRSGKIKSLRELAEILGRAREEGQKITLCHGVFDLLHPGHIVHFHEARKHGDLTVVTITPDAYVNKGPGRPVFHQDLRVETIAALEAVDYVALNEWPTATETIRLLKPHVYAKGSDYADASSDLTGRITDEEAAVRAVGGRIVFTEGAAFSSSHLINRFFSAYPQETQEYLQQFRARHSAGRIIEYLRALSDLNVLVVGEAILDQYCYCHPIGKSPKETIVATKFLSEESFAGGAVATANHLAGFCREVTFLTVLGPDQEEEAFLRSKLRSNIRMLPTRTDDRPTVRKRRFIEPGFMTKMFEIQYLDDAPLQPKTEREFGARLESHLADYDLVVVNDFGHGLLTEKLRDHLSASKRFFALNVQSNSANHGYNLATNYRRADFVSLDDPELHLASRNKYGQLRDLAAQVRREVQASTLLVSLGAHGSVVLSDEGWHETPALAVRVVDRTGAGDALFAVTSPCAFRKLPPDVIGFIGNCVGALAVEIVCNREPIDPIALYKFISSLLK